MRTVSDLFSRGGAKLAPELASDTEQRNADSPANCNKATFADAGARIGEDNEALRNLLIDTSHQFSAIDDLKATFSKLGEPLNNLLTSLEREKAANASAKGALAAIRTSHESLRAEFQALEKKSSDLAGENARLGRDLEASLQNARTLEDDKAKVTGEISASRVAMAMLVKQLGEEASNVRVLTEKKGLLADHADTSAKRIVGFESDLAHARERLSLLENDRDTLQAALDRTLAESSRKSRQLAESENALTDSRSKLQQVEIMLAAAQADRNKFSNACDEANERRQSEVYALELKLEALRSRSDAAEKLAAGVRESLAARTEEVRVAEAKLLEATASRSEAEKKAEHLASISEGSDQQTRKFEQDVAALTERCKVLTETLAASDSALVHAKQTIKSLGGQVEQLQSDVATNRAKVEEDIVQLNATIEHERCERTLAEGALETTRADYARLQREMAQERSMRRLDHQRRAVRNDLTSVS